MFGAAAIQGVPGAVLVVPSTYGANTLEVPGAVEAALVEMQPAARSSGITIHPKLFRPANFVETAIGNIQSSLLIGAVLVTVVLFFFLADVRTAFISMTAIPLSLLGAIIVLNRFGVSLNTLTLGGLAIAIGEVVDDAIIDVENILRRLRENQLRPDPRPAFQVVFDASLEVRGAVVYATFVVALVFLPVLTMSGIQGRFFAPLGIAFILAILASLLVALTVTPALCLAIFSRSRPHEEPAYLARLKTIHRRTLEKVGQKPRTIIGLSLALFLTALATLQFFGGEFLPEFREGHFVLQISTTPGTSLGEMRRLGEHLGQELLKNPHIKTVEQQIGRAEMGEDTWGPHRSEFHVELNPLPAKVEARVQDEIRATLASFPGIQSEVLTFLGDRIGETLAGETAQVVINVFGEDLDVLDQKAQEIAQVLSTVPGAADVQVKAPPGSPRLAVRLRPERLTQFGVRPVEVLDAIQTAYQGAIVAQTYEGNKVFDVAMVL